MAGPGDRRTATEGAAVASLANVQVRVSEQMQPGIAARPLPAVPGGAQHGPGAEQRRQPRPAPGTHPATPPVRLLGGDDGTGDVEATGFAGTVTADGRTGLHALDTVGVNIVSPAGPDQLRTTSPPR